MRRHYRLLCSLGPLALVATAACSQSVDDGSGETSGAATANGSYQIAQCKYPDGDLSGSTSLLLSAKVEGGKVTRLESRAMESAPALSAAVKAHRVLQRGVVEIELASGKLGDSAIDKVVLDPAGGVRVAFAAATGEGADFKNCRLSNLSLFGGSETEAAPKTPSPAYAEASASALRPSDATAAKAYDVVQLSPLTPCDLMLWADQEDSNLETDPANFAAWAAGGAATKPKKKMSYQDARVLAGTYMTYAGPKGQRDVKGAWIQSLINRGLSRVPLVSVAKTSRAGEAFSSEAIKECNTYVSSITQSTWGCLQHMVADYLAVKAKRTNLATAPDLVALPFYSWVAAAPGQEVTPGTKDPRRYVAPTVSYRTMKALSGYLPSVGKQKELDDLAAEAVQYFQNNEFDDYRAKQLKRGNANWVGYWEPMGREEAIQPLCSFEDAKGELRR